MHRRTSLRTEKFLKLDKTLYPPSLSALTFIRIHGYVLPCQCRCLSREYPASSCAQTEGVLTWLYDLNSDNYNDFIIVGVPMLAHSTQAGVGQPVTSYNWRVMQKDVRTSRSTCTSFGKDAYHCGFFEFRHVSKSNM